MSSNNRAKWTKNGEVITGRWNYIWASDKFHIMLDSRDPVTGDYREFYVYDEHPEFNGWKLVREDE